jgi:quercetin dioxygenase-like cupin family protein
MDAVEQSWIDAGIEIEHHFSDGLYIKKVTIPAGVQLPQHAHNYSHASVVVDGRGTFTSGGHSVEFGPGNILNVPAFIEHTLVSHTTVIWLCIHATEVTDLDLIDKSLIYTPDETHV